MKTKMDKSVQITLIVVAGAILITLLIIGSFTSYGSNTITSQGFSSIEVVPDQVGIYFNVQTEGATSSEARDENAEIVDTMKASLLANGFEEDEIQTLSFNIYPNYNFPNNNQITSYIATHTIRIELETEETQKIGQAIDLGVDAGAGIGYINFELSQELQNEYKAEAIKLATEDATIKAEALAEGSGNRLGKLVSISSSDFGYYPWTVFSGSGGVAEADAAREAATDIVPGNQEVTATVSAVFRIR